VKTVFKVDGRLTAVQYSFGGTNSLTWTHIDPLGMSEAGDTKPAYDPLGNLVAWQHAPSGPPPNAYPPSAASYGGLGSLFGSAQDKSCVFNGRPIACSDLSHQIDIGNVSAVVNQGGGRTVEVPLMNFGFGIFQVWVTNPDGPKKGAPPPDDDVVRVNHDEDDKLGHYELFLLSVAPQGSPSSPQNSKVGTPQDLRNSIYNDKALLAKINSCLKKLLGKNFSKVGEQTLANAPYINATLTSIGIAKKFRMGQVNPTTGKFEYQGPYAGAAGHIAPPPGNNLHRQRVVQ
jgi:hypothetical protein